MLSIKGGKAGGNRLDLFGGKLDCRQEAKVRQKLASVDVSSTKVGTTTRRVLFTHDCYATRPQMVLRY